MTAPGSRALDAPAMSAERRALEIAVKALRAISARSARPGYVPNRADTALRDIRALVPDAGEPP